MERNKNIREILGIKQEEIAMLLQVTRSQWSMYEIGKRDLPIAAKLKLSAMLEYVQKNESNFRLKVSETKMQKQKTAKWLEEQIVINQHKHKLADKKLKSIQKNYETSLNTLKLYDFLKTKTYKSSKEEDFVINVLKLRADVNIQKNALDIQAKHQLKLQLIEQELIILHTLVKKQV